MKGFLALLIVIGFFYLINLNIWFFLLAPIISLILALLCDNK